MRLRPATFADAKLLFLWRNDPLTRRNSFCASRVKLSEHRKWLRSSLSNPDRKIYIAIEKNVPVGTVRGDFSQFGYELSWTVAPEFRQRGFGRRIVQAAVALLGSPVFARIKEGNLPSEKIARAAGVRVIACR
jgi:RimJ/RimL family protein N-acetyltransferase